MRGKKAKAIRRAIYGDFSPRVRKYGIKVQERDVVEFDRTLPNGLTVKEKGVRTKKYIVTPKDPTKKKVVISGGVMADERRRKFKKAKKPYDQGIIKVDGHCKGARK